jgi:hypothetical protein
MQHKFSLDSDGDILEGGTDEACTFILDGDAYHTPRAQPEASMGGNYASMVSAGAPIPFGEVFEERPKHTQQSSSPAITPGPMQFRVSLANFVARNVAFDCTSHKRPLITVKFAVDERKKCRKKFSAKANEMQEVGDGYNVTFADDDFSFAWSCKNLVTLRNRRLLVELWDRHFLHSSKLIGAVETDLFTAATGPERHRLQLITEAGKAAGTMSFSVLLQQHRNDVCAELRNLRVDGLGRADECKLELEPTGNLLDATLFGRCISRSAQSDGLEWASTPTVAFGTKVATADILAGGLMVRVVQAPPGVHPVHWRGVNVGQCLLGFRSLLTMLCTQLQQKQRVVQAMGGSIDNNTPLADVWIEFWSPLESADGTGDETSLTAPITRDRFAELYAEGSCIRGEIRLLQLPMLVQMEGGTRIDEGALGGVRPLHGLCFDTPCPILSQGVAAKLAKVVGGLGWKQRQDKAKRNLVHARDALINRGGVAWLTTVLQKVRALDLHSHSSYVSSVDDSVENSSHLTSSAALAATIQRNLGVLNKGAASSSVTDPVDQLLRLQNANGHDALIAACAWCKPSSRIARSEVRIVAVLVEQFGMDIGKSVSMVDGSTPLHWAVIRDNEALAQYLLQAHYQRNEGVVSCWKRHVREAIEAGDSKGINAFHYCAALNRRTIAQRLLAAWASELEQEQQEQRRQYMGQAVDGRTVEGGLLELRDSSGRSALDWAVEKQAEQAVMGGGEMGAWLRRVGASSQQVDSGNAVIGTASITVRSGGLGIAINESHNSEYAMQIERITGNANVEQLRERGVEPHMVVMSVNGMDMRGVSYSAVRECLKARPATLTFSYPSTEHV